MNNKQSTTPSLTWLKTLSIGFSLVSFGIAIGIGGYILTTQKNQSISPIIQLSPTPDQTVDWKEYSNIKFKYQFRYPAEAELKEFFNDITIRIGKPIIISGACSEFNFNVNYRGNDFEPTKTKDIKKKARSIQLAGKDAYRIDGESSLEGYTCVDSRIFVVNMRDPERIDFILSMSRQKSKYPNLFDQILSTFKFTDQNPAYSQTPTVNN